MNKNIYFAGGCFWGVQEYFSRIKGVIHTSSGYANGETENPSYQDVCFKNTGHAETVHLQYDPKIVTLTALLEQYFSIVNPFTLNRQGADRGVQYRSGVYYTDIEDMEIIREYFNTEQKKHSQKIVVELKPLENYYLAEEYHQDYLKKNPNGYCHIALN